MNDSEDKRNYGLSILRWFMCFLIVIHHFLNVNIDKSLIGRILYFISWLSVPVFMIMTFYLNCEKLSDYKNTKFLDKRLIRLIVPLIGWAIIYYICYSMIDIIFGKSLVSGVKSLIWQIITGNSRELNVTMWYQSVLIMLTLLYWLIMHSPKYKYILLALSAVCLGLEYSGIYMIIYTIPYISLVDVLGRFIEMIPLATVGCLLYNKLSKKQFTYKRWLSFTALTVTMLCIFYNLGGWKVLFPRIMIAMLVLDMRGLR
jgi:hypothetical protein